MSWRNKCVLRIHWTSESSHDYGRRMTWVVPISQRLLCSVEATMGDRVVRRFAPVDAFDTPSLEGHTFVDFCLRASTRRF
jgi:hypothetical protein